MSNYDSIQGFFDFEQVYNYILYSLPDNSIFVEHGVLLGKSIIYFAMAAKENNRKISIFAVDTFDYDSNVVPAEKFVLRQSCNSKHQPHSFYDTFINNCKKCGVLDMITPVIIKSKNEPSEYLAKDKFFDAVFIDGRHDEESVGKDIETYLSRSHSDTIIAGHDIFQHSVEKAVDKYFTAYEVIGNSWLTRAFNKRY